MATATLIVSMAALPDPSDAQLLEITASLLGARSVPLLSATPALSGVLAWSCSVFYDGAACEARARQLAQALADYLHTRHVLPSDQATPAGLDAWASTARLAFLRTVLTACARYHVAGGV